MFRIAKEFSFCAGHFLDSAYTKPCLRMHGHNYRVVLTFAATELNGDGMVIDFGKIKAEVKDIIDAYDHRFLMKGKPEDYTSDPIAFEGVISLGCNPTAENIARLIYKSVNKKLTEIMVDIEERSITGYKRTVHLESVKIWETDTSWAEYS